MNATSLNANGRSYIPLAAGACLLAMIPFGFEVGTGGQPTVTYLEHRGSKGYQIAVFEPGQSVDDILVSRTPAENLRHVRNVLKPTVLDLAAILGVSRQAIYDWQSGKTISAENIDRIFELARAADALAIEGLTATSQILRRPIRNGKAFFDLVRDGDAPIHAAKMLIEVVRNEAQQREVLERRFANRKRPSRELLEEIGAPMLNEETRG